MTEAEAVAIQTRLARRVRAGGGPRRVRLVGGAVARSAAPDSVRAAAVVLSVPGLVEVESAVACAPPQMPYRAGFRAFHDGPALLAAIGALGAEPEVILFHGHGIAHPRGIGLASHLGVLLDLPTIGCAESLLVGEVDDPGPGRGARSPITAGERGRARAVGTALRTRAGCRVVLVSPGHRIGIDEAVQLVLACSRYRWPEPLRAARARLR